jgi:putative DNA primase/helicase
VPLDAAKAFVEARYFHDGLPMLHRYRGAYYDWRASHYRQRSDAAVRAALYDFLRGVRVLKDGKLEPFNPNSAKVSMVLDALASGTLLDDEREAPFWIREGDTAPNLLAVRNGLLDVVTEKLTPHSPLYFNVNALAFDYNPNAPTPERWVRFLKELWPDDKDARATLREMFGLFLTADTSFQKLFLLVGPKRSGKGTIGHVLTMLLGRENVAHPTMASLATQFGLWPLIDKRLAIVPDARLAEGGKAVEHLLSVSGEDSLTIDRKYASHWTGKLVARFLILTNELPRFADASGALASRFVLLTLRNSFYGREELDLKARLRVELPGILNWSLDGLNHLRERGHFLMPASSRDALRQLEDLASPVSAFVRERCVVEPAARVEKSVLWGAWKAWCEDAGIHRPGSVLIFARNMYAAYPQVRPTHSGGKKYFVGVDLRDG